MQPSVKILAPLRSRRRRVVYAALALALGTTLALSVWTYRRLSDPARLREIARAALQPLFNGVVSIGEVRFALPGCLVMSDLVVRTDPSSRALAAAGDDQRSKPSADAAAETIRCPEIELQFHLWDVLVGQWNPTSIVVRHPEVTLRPDEIGDRNAVAAIFRNPANEGFVSGTEAPSIEIDSARIRLDVGGTSAPTEWTFTVRGLPAPSDPLTLDLTWNTGTSGSSGRFQADLRNGRLRNLGGTSPALSIDTLTRLAGGTDRQLHRLVDRFRLGGTLRLTDFDVQLDGKSGNDSLVVELADGSATFPIEETFAAEKADAEGRSAGADEGRFDDAPSKGGDADSPRSDERTDPTEYASLTDARSRIALSGNRISIAGSAKLHGADVTLTGDFTFDGHAENWVSSSAGTLRADLTRFRLPGVSGDAPDAERRFVRASHLLRSIYHDYDPHGVVDVELHLDKAAGQPFRIDRGLVTVVDADASFRLRPYRGVNIRGFIEFNSDEITIRDITGEHDGGTIVVNGRVMGTDRCAACDVQVRATAVAIDEMLFGAVPESFVGAVREFQPVGRVGIEMDATRTGCASNRPAEWTSSTTVHLDGVSAEYVPFPYPLSDLRGSLSFAGDQLRVESVTGRHGRGKITATGTFGLSSPQAADVELAIDGTGLTFDDGIVNALPAEVRESWSAFQLAGRLGTHTRIFRDPDSGSVRQESTIEVQGATLRHTLLPLPFTEISGRLRLSKDRIETDELQAQCGQAAVSGAGWASLAGDAGAWRFDSPDVVLDDALVAALPSTWRQRLSPWQIEGPVVVGMRVGRDASAPGAPWSMDLSATVQGAVVRRVGIAPPFEDVRGTIQVDGAGIRSSGLDARLDTARIHVAFDASPAEQGERGFLSLSTDGLQLSPWIREILPARLRSAWTAADPTGRVDLRIDRLDFNSVGGGDRDTWSVDGRIDLHEVTLRGTPSLEDLNGRISGFGFLVDRLGGCTLSGDLALDSLGFLGRDLTGLHAAWSLLQTKDGTTNFGLDRIQGKVYGGTLTGQVEMGADDAGTRYTLSATAQDVEINPWLNAGRRASQLEPIPSDIRGEADAQLYFAGAVGDTDSQRGGGMVEIHDARLYKLPILLAILSVLNVSMPEQQAFDEAQASFYILGNRMRFNDIALRGPSLALLGSGVMTFPEQGLDLDLFSVNPRQWARLPGVSEVFEGTTRQLVGIEVTGSVRSPVVRVRPLQGITEEFRRLFQKRKPVPLRPATG